MRLFQTLSRRAGPGAALVTALAAVLATANGQQGAGGLLRIGSGGSLTGDSKEKVSLDTLQSFIKDETGLDNKIVKLKDWRELADKLVKGKVQVGVFQGFEFAWAQAKHPELKPLALAINVYRYPVAVVVAKRTDPAKDFAGLRGQTFSLPANGQGFLKQYVRREAGKKLSAFFSKVESKENVEEALDDVVDGVVQATVTDRAALEAYKRRKPGRFKQLKEVAKSSPFPPPIIAHAGLDAATRKRLLKGLRQAPNTDRGQTMLTLFKLTGFETPPADLGKVLARTRKEYPPPGAAAQ
jgi:ABC-type phosphate/phosphonate transport system substrate-binding protein